MDVEALAPRQAPVQTQKMNFTGTLVCPEQQAQPVIIVQRPDSQKNNPFGELLMAPVKILGRAGEILWKFFGGLLTTVAAFSVLGVLAFLGGRSAIKGLSEKAIAVTGKTMKKWEGHVERLKASGVEKAPELNKSIQDLLTKTNEWLETMKGGKGRSSDDVKGLEHVQTLVQKARTWFDKLFNPEETSETATKPQSETA